jgi:uncharacterized protein YcfJ
MRPSPIPLFLCLLVLPALPAAAQDPAAVRVVPAENVKLDYAQVLRVEPVYQTLRASRMEERCDPPPQSPQPEPEAREQGAFSRMLDSVKGVFSRDDAPPPPAEQPKAPTQRNCRMVQVDREFQRPIAYDVDYVYKGTKFRSRLAEDPGNRLRVRVSVTPYAAEAPARPASGP